MRPQRRKRNESNVKPKMRKGRTRTWAPTDNALLTNFWRSSDAEILLTSTDGARKSAHKRAKKTCVRRARVPTELPFLHAAVGGWVGVFKEFSNVNLAGPKWERDKSDLNVAAKGISLSLSLSLISKESLQCFFFLAHLPINGKAC